MQRSVGFSLIELMVAASIVALLAAIAYPSYLNQMMKGRRSAAQAMLVDIAQRQQQFFLDARSYAADLATLSGTNSPAALVPIEVSQYYNVAIVAVGAVPPTFKVAATPISTTPQAADVTLTIDNNGVKTPSSVW